MKHFSLNNFFSQKYPSFRKVAFFLLVLIGVSQDAQAAAITPENVLELVNADRKAIGLPALQVSAQLSAAANSKVRDMGEKSYFAHTSPSGKTPWDFIEESGYSYRYAGENLAIRFTNAEDEHQAWLNSPTHRANILSNKYLETGIAVWAGEQNGQKVLIVAEEFGTKPGMVIPDAPHQSTLPGEVASAATDRVSPEITQPQIFVVPSVLEDMSNRVQARMNSMNFIQLTALFGMGLFEIIAAIFLIRFFRQRHTF